MPSDYSTPDSGDSTVKTPTHTASINVAAESEWVKGDLPLETPVTPGPETHDEIVADDGVRPAEDALNQAAAASLLPAEGSAAAQPAAPVDEPLPPVGPPPVDLSLESLVESLLFVADGPTPVTRLAEALEVKPAQIEAALETLGQLYARRGLSLQRIRDKVQLTSAPVAAAQVQRFLGLAASAPLSKAALETLAIIAYQQPVTRPQIESIRGVNSDSVLKNLLAKGLVEESGRTEGPGRPVLYITTAEFLQHFGLNSLTDLPPLHLEGQAAAPLEILKG